MKFTRRLFNFALALVMILGPLSVTASASGTTVYGIGFVNASSLRLRSEASTSASTLTMAPRNDCVVVISKTGQWYKVNYNLQEGYMHEDYLDVLTKENAELGYGEITGDGVNLRTGPSTSYQVAAVSSKGNRCYILGLNSGWYKVIYNGVICYIRSDFLKLTEYPYENQASPNTPKFFRRGKQPAWVNAVFLRRLPQRLFGWVGGADDPQMLRVLFRIGSVDHGAMAAPHDHRRNRTVFVLLWHMKKPLTW